MVILGIACDFPSRVVMHMEHFGHLWISTRNKLMPTEQLLAGAKWTKDGWNDFYRAHIVAHFLKRTAQAHRIRRVLSRFSQKCQVYSSSCLCMWIEWIGPSRWLVEKGYQVAVVVESFRPRMASEVHWRITGIETRNILKHLVHSARFSCDSVIKQA